MKKIILLATALVCAWSVNAQQLDTNQQKWYQTYSGSNIAIPNDEDEDEELEDVDSEDEDSICYAYLYLADDADTTTVRSKLDELGILVFEDSDSETPWWVIFDENQEEALWNIPGVEFVEYEDDDEIGYDCDSVRYLSHADILQTGGSGLTKKYTGKGVIVGIVDGGIDFDNPNFKDAKGNSRVERAIYFSGNSPKYTEYKDMSQVPKDSKRGNHGTHVAGIAAGSFGFNPDDPAKSSGKYYGMAPESRLVLCDLGNNPNGKIIPAIKRIFAIADSLKMPAVVNISLGVRTGSYDGTDEFNREIGKVVNNQKGHIVCMSTSNTAHHNKSISFTTSDNVTPYTCMFAPLKRNITNQGIKYVYGSSYRENNNFHYDTSDVDIWSSDSEAPTSVKLFILDNTPKKDTLFTILIPVSKDHKVLLDRSKNVRNAVLEKYFQDYELVTYSRKAIQNNRWNIALEMKFVSRAQNPQTATPYIMGITTVAKQGTHILANIWGGTNYATFSTKDYTSASKNFVPGGPTYAFNNWICNDAVISVGCYNGKLNFTDVNGRGWKNDNLGDLGDISVFSSYGKDLRKSGVTSHPDVCADGCIVVSSYNSLSDQQVLDQYKVQYYGPDNKYFFATMQGTSMSTPAVTGGIALLLQADPTLTTSRVRELLKQTSNHTFSTYNEAKWGAGKFDALAGIRMLTGGATLLGDANEDGKIDVADITTIAEKILGKNPAKFNAINADVNKDGRIDVADITATASLILNGKK